VASPSSKSKKPYAPLNNIAALYELGATGITAVSNGATPPETNGTAPTKLGVRLEDIQLRQNDTRGIDYAHALNLARSIAAIGLLEPIVVDNQKRLLAGGHRRQALVIVKQGSPEALETCLPIIEKWDDENDRNEAIALLTFGNARVWSTHFPDELIPVRMLDFDGDADPDLALQVEVAENEHRKDYTRAEVRAIALRLKEAGFVDRPGRPRQGEKALRPTLNIIIGKSIRTIQRYLNESEENSEKTTTDVRVSKEAPLLQKAFKALKKWQKLDKPNTSTRKSLMKSLPDVLALLESTLGELETEQGVEND
jgi:ParB family transcriptional regulator, chromosome partitioning protein